MNSKNGMNRLRSLIIKYFAVVTFAVAVAESIVDSTYSKLCDVFYPDDAVRMGSYLLGAAYLFISLLLYVIGGIFFYRAVRRAIQEESARRANEQNLIYAAIAHDLKTPMTSVQGFAEALADGRIPPAEQQEVFDIILRKSRSMNDLTDLLSEYARLGAEEYRPELEKTDICVLVRDLTAENYLDFEEHDIDLEVDIPDTPITVSADGKELRRALTNLALNACRHNPRGIRALISVREEKDKCIVTVADSGSAIPDDMDIFEPFVTENTARTAGRGSGLGLSITKRIIERHGGSISLESGPENYTKAFVVTLPINDSGSLRR